MIQIELDGKNVEVTEGSMIMHAADKAGTFIPHFCYHKKLSIAANCRMCLVDVEKAPKPMPACATPVTQGMIVRTKSDKATKAQRDVMEFLLINHPLDCPICDQGGECQLQDLAIGYGGSASRYTEEKRVVFHKDVGPLLSLEEMSRCIHCTRCVRFGQEIAGIMELGMIHRGEHSEITTVTGNTVDSELSGNMIDLCPVGAITSKPYRYSARPWELSRRKSVSPHDSTGSNLIVQVKGNKVFRVLPLENESVNECWIADRDRFSYEAFNSADRLETPMIRQEGQWIAVDWSTALDYIAKSIKQIKGQYGAQTIGALVSPISTVEEMFLLNQLIRGLGSDNIDYRLRHSDFSNVAPTVQGETSARWLGMTISAMSELQSVLVVGSFLRKDHPLFAQRLRQAARRGGKVHSLHALKDQWLMPMGTEWVEAPSRWVEALAEIASQIALKRGVAAPISVTSSSPSALTIAESLLQGERKALLLGNTAAQHPQASAILSLTHWIASHTGASIGYLTDGGNAVGAQLLGLQPRTAQGQHAGQMLSSSKPLKAVFLLNVEPAYDVADPLQAQEALKAADFVVQMSPFKPHEGTIADVLLPIAPFVETSGTLVSAEGRVQSFHGVVKPFAETRPAWKVLRVIGGLLDLSGFEFDSSEQVRLQALGNEIQSIRFNNAPSATTSSTLSAAASYRSLERISDVPIYCVDSIVRRAAALQSTADAAPPVVSIGSTLWGQLQLTSNDEVKVTQGEASIMLPVCLDSTMAEHTVRIPASHPYTVRLGGMTGTVTVEKVQTR
jgi:NADH-quinone oxidoreductase subunit G